MLGNPFTAANENLNTVIVPYLGISDLAYLWGVRKDLQPAISAALDQDFDAHLEAANALPSGYGRANALAGVCWMYDRLPKNGRERPPSDRKQRLADAVCRRDEFGWTALHSTARSADAAVAGQLLPHAGASVSESDDHGVTVLQKAVVSGNAALVRLLLQVPCVSVNQKDAHGRTLLHLAAIHWGDDDVVALLIRAGVPVNELDCCGMTAQNWAGTSMFTAKANMLAAAQRMELAAQQALPASPVAPAYGPLPTV